MTKLKNSLIASACLMLLAGVLAILPPGGRRVQGSDDKKDSACALRKFYLTQTSHSGSQALTACAAGYHMASLWEIFDTSNLKYDTALGLTTADSGFGPPHVAGWIRTGNVTAETGNVLGIGNCNAWTSASFDHFGTEVRLPVFWNFTPATDISPWDANSIHCSAPISVWCVQD